MTFKDVPLKKMCPSIKAVIFDMDGTLCLPQPWMFPAMRRAIGLHDNNEDILTYIDKLPTTAQKLEAEKQLKQVEKRAMDELQPQPGLVKLLMYLTAKDIKMSICTRNLTEPVNHLIQHYIPSQYANFDYILTRDFKPTKPNPDPLLYISKEIRIAPKHIAMVGDSYDDMKSGRSAGCITVLLQNDVNRHILQNYRDLVDVAITDLSDLIDLV